jgi:hypothetical protein
MTFEEFIKNYVRIAPEGKNIVLIFTARKKNECLNN